LFINATKTGGFDKLKNLLCWKSSTREGDRFGAEQPGQK